VHPSLLPHYRGPAPIQHALLNGERESGVCVIEMLKMRAGPVDSGDIWGSEKTVSQVDSLNSPSLQGRLANRRWNHVWPITGHSGETRRPPSCLRAPADVTFKGLSPCISLSCFLSYISPKVEAEPQEIREELKMAPMISPADGFVDPRLQTADRIVRISRALEVRHQPKLSSTQSPSPALFQKPVVLEFRKPGQSLEAGRTLLQLHQPAVFPPNGSPVNRATGLQITTAKPPVGFGIYDRKGTGHLIIGCRDETYLRIRSVKQENRAWLDVREWWNGLNAGDHPISMSRLEWRTCYPIN